MYPDTEGIIGKAWDLGVATATNLPADRERWIDKCCADYGMNRRSVEGLTMQSRSLLGMRIDTPDADPVHVGLIVLESLTARGVGPSTIDDLGASAIFALVSQILVEVVQLLDEQDVVEFSDGRGK